MSDPFRSAGDTCPEGYYRTGEKWILARSEP